MLNPDHLQTFLAVADTGSFTSAATRLGFTQPAVSQQIKALETQIGATRLFRRVGQRMRLTQAGEELIGHARELVALSERAERHMLSLQGRMTGQIVLGCAPSTGERVLSTLVAAVRGSQSGVQFAIDVGPVEGLLQWLAEHAVQAVVVDEHPRRRSLDVLPLGREPFICIAARGHVLVGAPNPSFADLRDLPLIVPRRGAVLRRAIEDLLRRRGGMVVGPAVALETDSTTLAVQAAANGLGLAFVPQHTVARSRDLGRINIPGLEIEQHWYLVRSRGGDDGGALDELWSFVASTHGRKLLQRLGLKAPQPFTEEIGR